MAELFDPAEFAAFKGAGAPASAGFDPNEFASFKAKGSLAASDSDALANVPFETPSAWENFKSGLSALLDDPSKLSQVGPGRIVGQAISAATLPGDVYTGKVNPTSDEGIERATDLAMFATPTAPARMTTQGLAGVPRAEQKSALSDRFAQAESPTPLAPAPPPETLSRAETAAAAERAGIDIPRVALMPSMVQKVGAGLSDIPVVGSPLQKSAEAAVGQAGQRVGELAASVGTASREGAGQAAQEAIRTFKSDAIPAIQQEAFRPINEAIPKSASFVPADTINALGQIQQRLGQSAGKLQGESARIQAALENGGGNLTFQAIQDLRSSLGKEMADSLNRQGYDDFVSSHLYGTLSNDLRDAAVQTGGDALGKAFDAANKTSQEAWQQFKGVSPLARENVSPNSAFEQLYNLAMDRRGNTGKLAQVRNTMGERWPDVVATTIDRMGRNSNEGFSMQFFTNAYDKMSPGAKNVMFGEDVNRSVGDLAATFKALQGIERFKSKSQSANPLAVGAMGGGAAGGMWAFPLETALTGIAGYVGAKFLASPASARSIANWSKAYGAFVKNPSASLATALTNRAQTVGTTLAAEAGVGQAAPAIAGQLGNAVRAVNDNFGGRVPNSAQGQSSN